MSSQKLVSRDVRPLAAALPATVEQNSLHLCFRHRGGFATLTNRSAFAESTKQEQLSYNSPHGIVWQLALRDFKRLARFETGYSERSLLVRTYCGKVICAKAFFSKPSLSLRSPVPPPKRYVQLLLQGAAEHSLDDTYRDWLAAVPSHSFGPLGPEYFDTPSILYANLTVGTFVTVLAWALVSCSRQAG